MAASVLGVAFFALCCALSSSVVLSPAQLKKVRQTAKNAPFCLISFCSALLHICKRLFFCCFFALCCRFGCWVVLLLPRYAFRAPAPYFAFFLVRLLFSASLGLNSGRYDWEYLKFFPSSLIFKKSTDREKRVREIYDDRGL